MRQPTSTSSIPVKKSLRLWVKNNGHVTQKKKKFTYVYPRTVEAAQDPFVCANGKNKMFYLIAINVFPESKILRPDNSDSDTDLEEEHDCESETKAETSPPAPPRRKVLKKRVRKIPLKKIETKKLSLRPHNKGNQSNSSSVTAVTNMSSKTISKKLIKPTKRTRPTAPKAPILPHVISPNENKTDCSKPLQNGLSKSKGNIQNGNDIKSNNQRKPRVSSTPIRKLPSISSIPTITDSWHKAIQACAQTGQVSFSLSTPRQTRS